MAGITIPRSSRGWADLLRPEALVGRPEGGLFALVGSLSLLLIAIGDIWASHSSTTGALEVIPLMAAGWLLSTRLTLAVAVIAVLCRLAAYALGGPDVLTSSAQIVTIPFVAVVTRVAAVNVSAARLAGARDALLARVAYIATSADSLNEILNQVLAEMARDGLRGGTIALIDERDRLYLAAAEGDIEPVVMETRLPLGEGVMGRAAAEGRSILVEDLDAPGPILSPVRSLGSNSRIRSLVVVPLRSAGTVIGVLEIDSDRPGRFGEADLTLLEQIGVAISGAVQRAGALRLADQALQRRLRELTALLDAARRLGGSLELDVILREVCRSATEVSVHGPPDDRRAVVVGVRGDTATILAGHDEQGRVTRGGSFPIAGHPEMEAALRGSRAAPTRFEELATPLGHTLQGQLPRTAACAPIRVGSGVFGLLVVTVPGDDELDAGELRLLEGMADLAGLAIGNAESLRSERSRSEQLREHGERMAELDKAKSEFLRLASHELRGPLAVLRGYLSMLEDGSLGELPELVRRIMPTMSGKLGEMNFLIDQMLETARLDDSKLQLKLIRNDLRQLVDRAGQIARSSLSPAHRLHLILPDGAVTVIADPHRVTTILANLIENAIKYSPAGGEVRCELTVAGTRALVAVSDQGLGIDTRDLPRLFTRFGRLVTAENSHIAGTGLGLYLARELALMHGGDISVESVRGRGSKFTLALPLATPASEPAPTAASHR